MIPVDVPLRLFRLETPEVTEGVIELLPMMLVKPPVPGVVLDELRRLEAVVVPFNEKVIVEVVLLVASPDIAEVMNPSSARTMNGFSNRLLFVAVPKSPALTCTGLGESAPRQR
jgi:hypothetical protein